MARARIPHALDMRELKYGGRPEAERDRVAEALREAGRRSEALLLYEGRADHPFVDGERRHAIQEGLGFHLLAVRRIRGRVTPEDLAACARAAEARGRWLEARLCLQAAGDAAGVGRIAEHLPPSLRPAPPAEEPASD